MQCLLRRVPGTSRVPGDVKGSARAAVPVGAHQQASGWRDSKETRTLNVFSRQSEPVEAAGSGCAFLCMRISAGTARKRQEVHAEEEQWDFSLMAANKTI